MTTTTPRGAHLVGSINLPDAETVLRTASEILGDRLARIPDGETGERFHWIGFQPGRLAAAEGLERAGDEPRLVGGLDMRPVRIADGVDPASLALPPLGYAEATLASYAVFQRLLDDGAIRPGTRFQVSLPTPAAVVASAVVPDDRAVFEPVYAAALFGELDEILAAIPHDRLAIQWDTAIEFGFLENAGYWGAIAVWWPDVWTGVVERAVEQVSRVPADVPVGFHLCYGDVGETHFVEPSDTGRLVEFANRVTAAATRPIDWFHLPVPIERDDAAYFAPLQDLALVEETELYLGLVHRQDGVEGAARRIAAAREFVEAFGVGTECGIGRAPTGTAEAILEIHRVAHAW